MESTLAKRCMCTHRRILRCAKQWLRTRQIKMISQRKARKNAHISNLNCHKGTALWACPCGYPHALYFILLINRLHGNSLLQSQRARALSLTTGLVARIRLSLFQPNLSLWPGTETLLQAAADQGHPRSMFIINEECWITKTIRQCPNWL